jgi:hypothetical protein
LRKLLTMTKIDRRQFIKRASGLLTLAAPAIILPSRPARAVSTVFTATPNGSNGGDDGLTYRAFIVLSTGSLGQVRVTVEPSGGSLNCAAASIALSNSPPNTGAASFVAASTPVPLTFSGNPGFNVATTTPVVSDWVNLAWTTSDGLLISYCWGSPEGGAVNTSGLASGNETNFLQWQPDCNTRCDC